MKKRKSIVLEDVLVENYAAEGKSLARREGKVIFIENVVPGDIVDIRLSKNKKDWAQGYPIAFRAYSPERVEPFCQHFGMCGGCQWQMLPYHKQLQYKQQQVWDSLTRIGKVPLPEILPILGASMDKFYRNKLEYTFSNSEYISSAAMQLQKENANALPKGGVLGFHAKGFFDKIVPIVKCWLQEEPTNKIRNAIQAYALEKQYSFYDYRAHQGLLRNLLVRITSTGQIMVNLVFGQDDENKRNTILDFLVEKFPEITTLVYTLNVKKNDSIFDLEPVIFMGPGYIIEKLEQFSFKIGPKSFFQTNTRQAEKLYQVTRRMAELDGSQTLYDLYCGTGTIGLFCSQGAKKIVGVELLQEAIEDAKENARFNKVDHASFFVGDVGAICSDDFFHRHGRPDVIITDPPRAGMHEKLLNKILEMEARVLVYVSCNPATQARDLAILDQKYQVMQMQPVDMFPHTHHIENVIQLKIK
ncbi:MAG: 23S rRNA (uracil(1939)-C(5))-methyltransferase RlmD [Flavisolibacter sp.]